MDAAGCRQAVFVANPLVNFDSQRLGTALGNLAGYREEMIAAIDFMLVGY